MANQNENDSGKLLDSMVRGDAVQPKPEAVTASDFQERLREHDSNLLNASNDVDHAVINELNESTDQLRQTFDLISSALKFLPKESSIVGNLISETANDWKLLIQRWDALKNTTEFSEADKLSLQHFIRRHGSSATNEVNLREDLFDKLLDTISVFRAQQSELLKSLAELDWYKSTIHNIRSESAMLLSQLQVSRKKIEEFIRVEALQLKEFDEKPLQDSVSRKDVQAHVKRGEKIAKKLDDLTEHIRVYSPRSTGTTIADENNSLSEAWLNRFALTMLKGENGDDISENQNLNLSNRQRHVVYKILEAISESKPRMFVTMPAGSGKTRISSIIVGTLLRSEWNKDKKVTRLPRILFLPPNKTIADQTVAALQPIAKSRRNEILIETITQNKLSHGHFIFTHAAAEVFSKPAANPSGPVAVQEPPHGIFINYLNKPDHIEFFLESFGKDFFDLIIADDCDQFFDDSGFDQLKILEHFGSAIQLGFTAVIPNDDQSSTLGDAILTTLFNRIQSYFGQPLYIDRGVNNVAIEFNKNMMPVSTTKTWHLDSSKKLKRLRWKSHETKLDSLTDKVSAVLTDGQHRDTSEIIRDGWPVPAEAMQNIDIQTYFQQFRPRITKALRREYKERNNIENPGKTYSSRYFDNTHDAIQNAVTRGWIADNRPFDVTIHVDQYLPLWDGQGPERIDLCIKRSTDSGASARWWNSHTVQDGEAIPRLHLPKDKYSEKDIEKDLNLLVPRWIEAYAKQNHRGIFDAGIPWEELIQALKARLDSNGLELVVNGSSTGSNKFNLHPDDEDAHYETARKNILSEISTQEKNLRNAWANNIELTPLVDANQRYELKKMFWVDQNMLPLLAVDLGLIYKNGSKFEFTNYRKNPVTDDDKFNRLFSVEINGSNGTSGPLGIVDTKGAGNYDYDNDAHRWLNHHKKLKEEILSIINLYIAETIGPITETDGTARYSRIPEQEKLEWGYRSRFNEYISHICGQMAGFHYDPLHQHLVSYSDKDE